MLQRMLIFSWIQRYGSVNPDKPLQTNSSVFLNYMMLKNDGYCRGLRFSSLVMFNACYANSIFLNLVFFVSSWPSAGAWRKSSGHIQHRVAGKKSYQYTEHNRLIPVHRPIFPDSMKIIKYIAAF